MPGTARTLVAFAAASFLATGVAPTADAPASAVTNACHVSPIVEDLDHAARFYHDLLGMELNPPPPPGPLPVDTDRGHLFLHGVPDARLRFIQARIPGVRCGIEIVELTNVARTAVHRRVQDPGAVTLVLTVRDVDAALASLRNARVPIVTSGAVPLAIGGARAVTVQDPDGHYVELQQREGAPTPSIAASSNVVGIGLRLTVANVDRALSFYAHVLGITGTAQPFEHDRLRLALAGLPASGELRNATVAIPGTSHTLDLVEFRGVGSKPAAAPSRVQDPGSYRLQLTFTSIDDTLQAMAVEGMRTISSGGQPVTMTFGGNPWRLAIVPDPQNLFLIVQQAPSRRE